MEKSFTSLLTSKGQVTVPQEIRERLGLKKGDRVEFVAERNRTVVRRAETNENPFAKYAGALPAFAGGRKEINAWVRDLRGRGDDEE
jgi:antitoxin PrlF